MDYLEYTKAQIGWGQVSLIVELLGRLNSKVILVYLFETHELVITDPSLLKHLDYLEIHYTLHEPPNAVKFVRDI